MNALILSFVGEKCFVCGSDDIEENETAILKTYSCADCEVTYSVDNSVVVGYDSSVAWLDGNRSVLPFLIQLDTVRRDIGVEYE